MSSDYNKNAIIQMEILVKDEADAALDTQVDAPQLDASPVDEPPPTPPVDEPPKAKRGRPVGSKITIK